MEQAATRGRGGGRVPSHKMRRRSPVGDAADGGRAVFRLRVDSGRAAYAEPYPARSEGTAIQALQAEPAQPHVKLAQVIATSQSADEDALRDKILARASQLGADDVQPLGLRRLCLSWLGL